MCQIATAIQPRTRPTRQTSIVIATLKIIPNQVGE